MANIKRIKELFSIDTPSVQEGLRIIRREDAKNSPELFTFSQKWLADMTGYSVNTCYSVLQILIHEGLVAVQSRTVRGRKSQNSLGYNINLSEDTRYVLVKMGITTYFFEAILLWEQDKEVSQKTFKVRATSLVEAAIRIQELGHADRNLLSLRLLPTDVK